MSRLNREVAWAAVMLLELLLLAGSAFVGSALLRFSWLAQFLRIPSEDVLVPLVLAGFLVPILTAVAAIYWLGVALVPSLERSPLVCCLAHLVLVAAPTIVISFSNGALGVALLVLGSIAVIAPRILFVRLRPWAAA